MLHFIKVIKVILSMLIICTLIINPASSRPFFDWSFSLENATWDNNNKCAIVAGTITNSPLSTFDLFINDQVDLIRYFGEGSTISFRGTPLVASSIRVAPGSSWYGDILRITAESEIEEGSYIFQVGLYAYVGSNPYPGQLQYGFTTITAYDMPPENAEPKAVPEMNTYILVFIGFAALAALRKMCGLSAKSLIR